MTESLIDVRKAERKDADKILNFQLLMAFETEQIHLDEAVVKSGVRAVFDDPLKGTYYVAEINGEVVASLMTTPEWSDWRNRTVLWIQSVYVAPAFRQRGLFRKMYEYLKQAVEQDPAVGGLRLYVDRNNQRAQEVYARMGMDGSHYQVFEWMK